LFAFYQLLTTTGLRRSEALGLRWSDIDLEHCRLAVNRSLVCVGYALTFSEPKTTRSRRVIALDPTTASVLQAHRVRQLEERLAVAPGYTDGDFAFATVDGLPLHPQGVAGAFDRHVRSAGLPRLTLHGLRHSYATAALVAGVETKLISERLGHSSTAITSDVYTHVPVGMQDDAARRVAALILEG
jgi:integrase